ncbi:TM2 domain-containing protein [Methylobacterium sp. 77]|uniref:TM2 domain-containing protein n=1 Tax=Methylobacterium sp. 77 TaxID=1101192 RepID=UPI000374A946|nr:TM2 domain-containing protein [Methylobacterium sp. 77]
MSLTIQDRILIETRIGNEAPSVGLAYALWFFLGIVSAHRFYLGRPGTAILQIVSYLFLVGFIWLLIDAFLIPAMVRGKQGELRDRFTAQATAMGSA